MNHTLFKLSLLFTIFFQTAIAQNVIEVKGIIVDETNYPIPYAAVGIPSKYIGTASTEDGTFSLKLSKDNLQDSLEVSSIGYKTVKILIKDYVASKKEKIVLQEDIVSLDEVKLLGPRDYVSLCVKNLKKTTLSKPHKLDILYRRFSAEEGKTRFLIEHYLHVIDRGPSSALIDKMKVVEGRQSADYRFVKKKSKEHNMNWVARHNPLRPYLEVNSYNWKRTGDSSYDGEDLIIVEGRKAGKKDKEGKKGKKGGQYIRLYIGIDTYGLYKMETSYHNTTYIYKKNVDGKLYLSYHTRDVSFNEKLNDHQKKLMKTTKNRASTAIKSEVFVLGLDTNKKNFRFDNYGQWKIDMADLKVKYNPSFWNNFSLPPETKFYKENVKDIESIYGVPIEKQFRLVNN